MESEKFFERKSGMIVLLIFLAIFWGMSFYFTTAAVQKLGTMELLGMRWSLSAVIFLVLIAFRIIKIDIHKPGFKYVALTGALQPCIYSIFETNGIKMTSTSESSIIIAIIPCMVLILGTFFLNKKVNWKVVLSILMAFAGVVICTTFSPEFTIGGKWQGYLVMFGAVMSGAFYAHASAKAGETYNAIEITAIISIMGGVFFTIISLAMGYGLHGYKVCIEYNDIAFDVIFLGVFCSCLCYIIFNQVLGHMKTAIASNLSASLTTSVGVISGVVLAGDPFGWFTIVGLALTITGVCLSTKEA